MNYSDFILMVNASCIFLMIVFTFLLLFSTHFRGENAYAAAIILFTTIPTYLYNVCRSQYWYEAAWWLAPFGFSMNVMLMPLLWMYVKRVFNKHFKLSLVRLLHFLPTLFCIVLYFIYALSQPESERFSLMIYENTGSDNWLGLINSSIIFTQMIVYFTLMFVFLHRAKYYIRENFSEAEWMFRKWIFRFVFLLSVLSVFVIISYLIYPRVDEWLTQILNVIAMIYLVYNSLITAKVPQTEQLSIEENPYHNPVLQTISLNEDITQLQDYALSIIEYLETSEAYLNADLTLQDLAKQTGISSRNISRTINRVLNKSFFELINSMRIEKSKELLISYKEDNRTIDVVAQMCGFKSRFILNNAFKKSEGMTPSQWLKKQKQ